MAQTFRCSLGKPDERNVTSLTLKLRLALEPLTAAGGNKTAIVKARGQQFNCVPYPAAEFESFKARFQQNVAQAWSGKVFIVVPEPGHAFSLPAATYNRFVHPGQARFKPMVECRLAIDVSASNPDYRLVVIKRAPGEKSFPSFMYSEKKDGRPDGVLDSTDLDMKLLRRSVWKDDKLVYADFDRRTAHHEVGHLLGLEHVNMAHPVCKEDSNDSVCYGDTIWKAGDMMGFGGTIRAWHGRPWLLVLKKLVKHDKGWRLVTDPATAGGAPIPTLVDHIRATLQSAALQLWQEVSAA
jgi:hypothetical protein